MHTATLRKRVGASLAFVVVLTLGSLSSQTTFAQDAATEAQKGGGGEITALVERLEARAVELDELSKKAEQSANRAAAAVLEKEASERRTDYRRDLAKLVGLVLTGADAGAEVADGRAAATKLLQKDAPELKTKMAEVAKQLGLLADAMEEGPPEEVQKARKEFVDRIPATTRLLKYFEENIRLRTELGVDAKADAAYLTERLKARADVGAAFLKKTKAQIDELSAQPGVETDAEAQKTLALLRTQRDVLAESQRVNVDLMDRYGLDTAEFRRGIITATGKLSQDILDKKVAAGLVESWFADGAEWLRTNGANLVFQVITFLLILLAFWFLARTARGVVRRAIGRSKLNISSLAQDFFIKMTSRLVMLIGFIIAIAQLGVEVAPLLAGLGIAGFIVGFALQDTLSNFAAGLMILVYRPFDVGDAVEAGGVLGKVDQMNLVSTMILTFDNQLLVVPNKQIWGGIIRNITHKETRRVDMTFGIGYSDDIPKAEKVLMDIVTSHEKVLDDPEPVVKLHTLGESSVDFVVRPWSRTDDYWQVYWDVTREVKRRFDAEGISIPFPQRDVHIHREGGEDKA